MLVQPYLFFEGSADEAIAFYQKALGAKVTMLMRYKEHPGSEENGMVPPGSGDKIMHMSFTIGDSVVMASDGMCSGKSNFQGVQLALTADGVADAERLFAAISEGGQVIQPLIETFFSPRFGMATDRFGLSWMVTVAQ